MSSATNSPAITGVSNPNPQKLPGGTPPPMSSQYPGDPISGGGTPGLPTGTGIPIPIGKGAGPSVPTTPAPPPGRGGRSPGDVRPLDTPGAPIAQSHDIAQRFADVYNQMGQGGGQPPVPLPPRVLDPNRPPPPGHPSWPPHTTPPSPVYPGPWSTGTFPSPIPDPVMDPNTPIFDTQLGQLGFGSGQMTSGAKPLQGMRANFPPGLPTKRPDVRTGPRSKYPQRPQVGLTRPPAIPMRDPTMPSPSTGYSIPFGKRRRGLV